MQHLHRCPNLPSAEIEATCGYQSCYRILSHVWEEHEHLGKKSLLRVTRGDRTSCPTGKCLKHWEGGGGLYSVHGTCYSFIQLGICEKKSPAFMAINVNHAANSSVNHHWERKQACAFRKANSFMRKPPRSLAVDDTSISLPRKLSRGKKKTILEGYTT